MKNIIAIALFVVVLSACTQSSQNPLIGQWESNETFGEGKDTVNSNLIFVFDVDGTGFAEFKIRSAFLDPIYRKMNFSYELVGDSLQLQYVGHEEKLNSRISDITESSFDLIGFDGEGRKLHFIKKGEVPANAKDHKIAKDNPNKIWILTLGQSLDAAKEVLIANNYDYTENEYGLKGSQMLNYMGVDWDRFSIAKDSHNNVKRILLYKEVYPLLTEDEKQSLVASVDEIYGEHRLDQSTHAKFGNKFWTWQNGEYHVSFSCLEDIGHQELVFEK